MFTSVFVWPSSEIIFLNVTGELTVICSKFGRRIGSYGTNRDLIFRNCKWIKLSLKLKPARTFSESEHRPVNTLILNWSHSFPVAIDITNAFPLEHSPSPKEA